LPRTAKKPAEAKTSAVSPKTAKPRKKKSATDAKSQPILPVFSLEDETLDLPTMETWLWDAACQIRGVVTPRSWTPKS
jgi:hypothetical protein